MKLLDISTKKFPNTFTKVDDEVYDDLMKLLVQGSGPKKWRCHAGGKGELMVVTSWNQSSFRPAMVYLSWVVYSMSREDVALNVDNLKVWGRPFPIGTRIMHKDRDPLNNQIDNLVILFKGQPYPKELLKVESL